MCAQSNDIKVYTNNRWHNHNVAICCK